MGQTKNHMSTFDETQYWGPWGGSEVGAGAKKRRKKQLSNTQSGVRKMIARTKQLRIMKLNEMKLNIRKSS